MLRKTGSFDGVNADVEFADDRRIAMVAVEKASHDSNKD